MKLLKGGYILLIISLVITSLLFQEIKLMGVACLLTVLFPGTYFTKIEEK